MSDQLGALQEATVDEGYGVAADLMPLLGQPDVVVGVEDARPAAPVPSGAERSQQQLAEGSVVVALVVVGPRRPLPALRPVLVIRAVEVVDRGAQDLVPATPNDLRQRVGQRGLARRRAPVDADARGMGDAQREQRIGQPFEHARPGGASHYGAGAVSRAP